MGCSDAPIKSRLPMLLLIFAAQLGANRQTPSRAFVGGRRNVFSALRNTVAMFANAQSVN